MYRLKLESGYSKLFVIGSAAEMIAYAIKHEKEAKDPKKWNNSWILVIDDNSAIDYNYINLKFHHFHEPEAPFMKRIISNMYINGLSSTIVGFSEDSSRNSKVPDIDVFMKKSIGIAVFQLEDPKLADIIDWVEIDMTQISENTTSIGDSVIMFGSGFNVYSPEYFSQALDKGYISQIIGNSESYLCNMTTTGSSQCFPVWNQNTESLIGIKLPVFINPKNMYTYSFILSIQCLIKSLTYGHISAPRIIEDNFSSISKAIVKIRAGAHYGTGVIIHPSGYVLTNRHVIEDSDTISINEEFDAEVFWKSTGLYDLALVKITPTKIGI